MANDKIDELENQILELENQTKSIDDQLFKISDKQTSESQQAIVQPGKDRLFWSEQTMLTMSLSILAFGIFIIICISYLINKGKDSELLLRVFGVPVIIISAVFLVIAGYTESQIAPVIGLLGTIAGYLLGKSGQKSKENIPQFKEAKHKGNNETIQA